MWYIYIYIRILYIYIYVYLHVYVFISVINSFKCIQYTYTTVVRYIPSKASLGLGGLVNAPARSLVLFVAKRETGKKKRLKKGWVSLVGKLF